MKKISYALLLLLTIASCKKTDRSDCIPKDKISLADARVISQGMLVSTTLPGLNGQAKIYLQKNGKYVLGLEQVTLNTGNELSAYLSTALTLSSDTRELFSFKSIDGELYYELPAGIDVLGARFLVIQGDVAQQPAATAELK